MGDKRLNFRLEQRKERDRVWFIYFYNNCIFCTSNVVKFTKIIYQRNTRMRFEWPKKKKVLCFQVLCVVLVYLFCSSFPFSFSLFPISPFPLSLPSSLSFFCWFLLPFSSLYLYLFIFSFLASQLLHPQKRIDFTCQFGILWYALSSFHPPSFVISFNPSFILFILF